MNLNTTFGPGDSSDAQGDMKDRIVSHAAQLATDYWQDMEIVSNAFVNGPGTLEGFWRPRNFYQFGESNHPGAVEFLSVFMRNNEGYIDPSVAVALFKTMRKSMNDYIEQLATDDAQEQAA